MTPINSIKFSRPVGSALTRALAAVDEGTLWQGADGAGVTVAMVDSGVSVDNTGLESSLVSSIEFEQRNGHLAPVERPPTDDHGHGTACAGLVNDFAPKVQFISLRVLMSRAEGSVAQLLAALTYVASSTAQVVNLSLGTSSPSSALRIQRAVASLNRLGKICVAACGTVPNREDMPCRFGDTVAVDIGHLVNGAKLGWVPEDIVPFRAPGMQIAVRAPGGGGRLVCGSSFAAAQVSGMVAALWSKYPGVRTDEMSVLLRRIAETTGT